jgi:hypothetical protein
MRNGALTLTVAVALAACGGATPALSTPTSSPVVVSSASPSASLVAAPWPSGEPVPQDLAGVWRLGTSAGTMRLSGNTYAFGQSNGNVVVNGNEIDFFNGTGCGLALPDGVGRYSWTLSGREVHFVALAPDPCGRSDLLNDVTWRRP